MMGAYRRGRLAAGTILGSCGMAAALTMLIAPGAAKAQNWRGGESSWDDASRWNPATVPDANSDASMSNGGTIDITSLSAAVRTMTIAGPGGQPATVAVGEQGVFNAGQLSLGEWSGWVGTLSVGGVHASVEAPVVLLGRNGGTGIVSVTEGGRLRSREITTLGLTGLGDVSVQGSRAQIFVDDAVRLGGTGAGPSRLHVGAGGELIAPLMTFEGDVAAAVEGSGLLVQRIEVNGGNSQLVFSGPDASWAQANIREQGGTLVLTKRDAGTLLLTGDNDFSGGVSIEGGRVDAVGAGRNSLGRRAVVSVGAGATLALAAGYGWSGAEDDDETVAGLTGGGTIVLGAQTLTVDTAGNGSAFYGSLTGSGTLRKTGAATLAFSSSTAYGATAIDGGTLQLLRDDGLGNGAVRMGGGTLALGGHRLTVADLSGTGAIDLGAGGVLTLTPAGTGRYAGSLTGTGNARLVKNGAGTMALDGAIGGAGLGLAVNGGTVVLGGANSYALGTTASGGARIVVGSDTALGTGSFTVAPGGAVLEAAVDARLANPIQIQRAAGFDTVLAIEGTHDLRLDGTISTSGSGGTGGGLVMRGTGLLTLGGVNSYTGGTLISAGGVRALNDRALGSGAIRMTAGTMLSFASSPYGTLGPITIDGDVTFDVDAGKDVTFGQGLAGAGGFTKTGAGRLSLDIGNSFRGDVHVKEGRLYVDNRWGYTNQAFADTARVIVDAGARIDFDTDEIFGTLEGAGLVDLTYLNDAGLEVGATNADFTFAGTLTGGSPTVAGFARYAITKRGTGTFTLSGTSDSPTGLLVSAGTLALEGSTASSLIDVSSGGRLRGGGSVAGLVQIFDGTLEGGPGGGLQMGALTLTRVATLDVALGAPGGAAPFTVAGDVALAGTLRVRDGGGFGAPGVYGLIRYGGRLLAGERGKAPGMTIGAVPAGVDAGTLSLQTSVAGQVNLVSNAGLTLRFWDGSDIARHDNGAIDGGAGQWSATARSWTDAAGLANGAMRPVPGFAVFQGSGGTVTLDATAGALAVAGMQFAGDGYRLTGDALTLAGSDGAAVIRVGDGTAAGATMVAEIASALTGAATLVKADAGTLILSGVNGHAGGTRIDDGVLAIGSDAALGAASGSVTLAGGALQTRADMTSARALALTGTGAIDVAGGTALNWQGAIGGAGALVKRGDGTLTLAGPGAYTGGTRVEAGTLIGSAASIRGDLNNAGTVVLDAAADARFDGAIAAIGDRAGRMVKTGAGTLTLGGQSTLDWTVGGGTLAVRADGFAGSAAITDGATLRIDGDAAATLAGRWSGAGTIAKTGAGTARLTGSSDGFAGTTRIEGGRIDVDGALGGRVTVAAGATLGGSGSAGDVAVAAGGHLAGAADTTLTLDRLTLDPGAQIDVALGASGGGARFAVRGDLTLAGTLNLSDAGGFGAGVYRLFDYGGTLTDQGLVFGTLMPGASADDVALQTSVAGQVNLISALGMPLLFWDGGDPALHNNGVVDGGSGTWRADGRNWTDATGLVNGAMRPVPGVGVFQGAGSTVTIDGSAGAVAASGLQFASDGYRLTGDALTLAGADGQTVIRVGDGSAAGAGYTATIDAALTGAGDLVKTDLGTLVLTGANRYSGNSVVRGGTLIGNAATIRGDVLASGTVVFDQAGDARFAGSLAGIDAARGRAVKRGAGALTLDGRSALDWTIEAGRLVTRTQDFAGDAVIAAGATLAFAQTQAGSYAGRLSGAGTLAVSGADVTLTGDSAGFAGQLSVTGAAVRVNGTLGGVLTIGRDGWLRGNATLGSVTVAAGGTIAPGNSIGTITIAGDLTLAAGSRYEVEVDPTGTASDRIDVTGTARLGGAVAHIGQNGNYRPRTRYTILTAGGGIEGRFDAVTSDFAFLDPGLEYGANAVTLTLSRNDIRFDAVAATANQRAVAGAAQTLTFGNPVYDALVLTDAPQARAAFDALSGEIHAGARAALIMDTRLARDAVLGRLAAPAGDGAAIGIWGQALGSWGRLAGDGNAARLRRSATGALMGIEGTTPGGVRLGVFGGYQHDDLTGRGSADIDGYQLGLYLGTELGGLAVRGGYGFAWHRLATRRAPVFAGFADRTEARYGASTAQLFGELAYRVTMGGAAIEPFANLAHVVLDSEAGGERGGAAALGLRHGTMTTELTTTGLRGSGTLALGAARIGINATLGWRHAFGDRRPVADLTLGGARFRVAGAPLARDAMAAELGLGAALGERLRLDLSYSGEVAARAHDHGARATLSWRF